MRHTLVITAAFGLVIGLWLACWFGLRCLIPDPGTRGQFGDQFGTVNALFTGLAFSGVALTLYFQYRESQRVQKERTADLANRDAEAKAQAQKYQQEILVAFMQDTGSFRRTMLYLRQQRSIDFFALSLICSLQSHQVNTGDPVPGVAGVQPMPPGVKKQVRLPQVPDFVFPAWLAVRPIVPLAHRPNPGVLRWNLALCHFRSGNYPSEEKEQK